MKATMSPLYLVGLLLLGLVCGIHAEDDVCGATDQAAYRPCPTVGLPCVRNYLQVRSACQSFSDEDRDSFVGSPVDLYAANFNLSAVQTNILTEGFSNARLFEFTVNLEKDLIVLTVEYTNLTLKNHYDYSYFQPSEEPITFQEYSTERYPHLYITSYISGVNNPQWASAYHVHYQEGTVEMSYERECVDENDGVLDAVLKDVRANIDIVTREVFLYRNQQIQEFFVKRNLCNFLQ
ncbi:hypothetical protein JYU34_010175 [Plutella xylostella]|uniref:Uncharacterized protein n=1 Tax=Plutella xylostella TaxID=51655 RepID=A0ABQ7QHY8_PLUXY|nr:hypothetical protein JYU34_010175 [Plutella xylostella]